MYQTISWQLELIIPMSLGLVTHNCNFSGVCHCALRKGDTRATLHGVKRRCHLFVTTVCINSPACAQLSCHQSRPWADAHPGLIQPPGKAWCPALRLLLPPSSCPAPGWGNRGPALPPLRGQLQLPAHRKPLSQTACRQQPIPEYKRWGDHQYLFKKTRNWPIFGQ